MVVDLDIKPQDVDRIIEMAWEDMTPFDAIDFQFNLKEKEVIQLMRSNLKSSSFGSSYKSTYFSMFGINGLDAAEPP